MFNQKKITPEKRAEGLAKGNIDIGQHNVSLVSLEQYEVYEGLLEGCPTQKMNDKKIKMFLKQAEDNYSWCNCYLVKPQRKKIERKKSPFGISELLPQIVCIGRFSSLDPAKEKDSDLSMLVIVWFQNKFALPIDSSVAIDIEKINWKAEAKDIHI
ncbi:hypothetical protein [Candidatus Uabimicrobium sp. HlEnr_7]|uniref:hypothetical protein n=1 Tax=Candidatus Uabimicrobium helgolandensis TaxID=3095367 RepID=UPI003555E77B